MRIECGRPVIRRPFFWSVASRGRNTSLLRPTGRFEDRVNFAIAPFVGFWSASAVSRRFEGKRCQFPTSAWHRPVLFGSKPSVVTSRPSHGLTSLHPLLWCITLFGTRRSQPDLTNRVVPENNLRVSPDGLGSSIARIPFVTQGHTRSLGFSPVAPDRRGCDTPNPLSRNRFVWPCFSTSPQPSA